MTRLLAGIGRLDPITTSVVSTLSDLGLAFPGPIEREDMDFPSDLTSVSMVEIGELHSYWSAQYARSTTIHGVVIAQKRSLKFEMTRLRAVLPSAEQAELVEGKRRQLEAEYARVDAADAMLSGLVDAQKKYVDACSRELTRRQIEVQLAR